MKLFKMVNYQLEVEEEVWGLSPFSKILKRDKSKNKDTAFKEVLFIYYYSDIKSDYLSITTPKEKAESIKKDISLPEKWEMDNVIEEAIELYNRLSCTVSETLYKSAIKSANDISDYLNNTNALLKERDDRGKPVYQLNAITAGLKSIPGIMRDLKASYTELLKEQEDLTNKKKGSRTFGMFEDGLN